MTSFRKADFNDIELIRTLAREIWTASYKEILDSEQIEYMLEMMYSGNVIEKELNSGIIWELIEYDHNPIGYIAVTFQHGEAKLNKLYLKNEVHGHGIGQMSLAHVIDLAKEHHASQLYLTVNKNNNKAVKAYERAGFKRIDSQVFDIGNGYVMDDFIYSFLL